MAKDIAIKIGAIDAASAVFGKVGSGVKALGTKLKSASASITGFGQKLTGAGTSLVKFGGAISGVVLGSLGGLIAVASEGQETMGKFSVVFAENAAVMEAWSDKTASAMGVSETAMAGMLSGMQDLLVPMGVLPDSAEGMSKSLSTLAIDLGSFNNMSTDQVIGDLQSAMTGSGDVMKKYGVILSAAAVNQELLNMGMDPKTATEAAKAQARLTIIMAGTTAAQGDAIRTSGSFANQMKSLKATVVDVASVLGGALVDDLAGVVGSLRDGAKSVKDFMKGNSELVRVGMLAAAAIGGIGIAIVALGGGAIAAGAVLGGFATIISTVVATVSFLLTPIGLVVIAIAALAGGFVYAAYESGQLVNIFDAVMASMKDLFAIAKTTFGGISTAISNGNWAGAAAIAWAGVKAAFWTGLDGAYGAVTTIVPAIWESFKSLFSRLVSGASAAISTIISIITNPFDAAAAVKDFFSSGALNLDSEDGGIAGYLKRQRIASEDELNSLVAAVSTKTKEIDLAVDENATDIAQKALNVIGSEKPVVDIQANYKLSTDPNAPVIDGNSGVQASNASPGKAADIQGSETRLLVRGRVDMERNQMLAMMSELIRYTKGIMGNTDPTESMSGDHPEELKITVIE